MIAGGITEGIPRDISEAVETVSKKSLQASLKEISSECFYIKKNYERISKEMHAVLKESLGIFLKKPLQILQLIF